MKTDTTHEKLSIVCFSGDYDKLLAAFTMATGAAATNRQVTMFFTFWGLNALKRIHGRRALGRTPMARLFNWLMGGLRNLPLSRLNFAGLSPRLMERMMRRNNVATLQELIQAARELGVRLVACEMAMHILELERGDLVEGVEDIVGVATFLNESRDAHIIFI